MLTPELCLQQVPELASNHEWLIAPLPASAGNRVYRVRSRVISPTWSDLVLRIHQPELAFSVDRQRERLCWQSAAQQDLAPPLLYWAEDDSFSLGGFIQSSPAPTDPLPARVELIAALHRLPLPGEPLNYLHQAHQYAARIPPGMLSSNDTLSQPDLQHWLRQAQIWYQQLQRSRLPATFCHHDLTPGNLIFRRNKLYCLDFEYANGGHPLFDLAVCADDLGSGDEQRLLQGYFDVTGAELDKPELTAFDAARKLYWLLSLLWCLRLPASEARLQIKASCLNKLPR